MAYAPGNGFLGRTVAPLEIAGQRAFRSASRRHAFDPPHNRPTQTGSAFQLMRLKKAFDEP
jgi:hypothetical protein